jgi:hypothetical protein
MNIATRSHYKITQGNAKVPVADLSPNCEEIGDAV